MPTLPKIQAATLDTHAHLYFDRFDEDRDATLERARNAGFERILNVGIDVASSLAAIELARNHPEFCFASVGLHPTETDCDAATLDEILNQLSALVTAAPAQVCAIGEIGFDFYWDKSPADRQEVAFRRQLDLAEQCQLPVIIHCRDAMEACLRVVEEYADRVPGVFHCFGGSADEAERIVALGWYLSFAGNVTFPKAAPLREAAARVGPERLLLETDAPFMAPQVVRGARNESSFALHTLVALAELFDIPPEDLARQTTANGNALFRFAELAGRA